MASIDIVGGGIFGLSIGLELTERGRASLKVEFQTPSET